MAKLGVITDGISTDFEHALKVMSDNNLNQAELQFLWDKEVGDLSKSEIEKAEELLKTYNMEVAHKLGSPLVRIMSFRKEMVLFGEHGAEKWNVSDGAWGKLVELLGPVVQQAKEEEIMLVV